MTPRILVATDLSDAGGEAVLQADAHARAMDGVLGVCHVLPGLRLHMLFPQRYGSEATQEAAQEVRARDVVVERISSLTRRSPSSFETFVEHGTEYAAIVRRAEEWRASLVVIGSHGHTGATRGVLGGVAERVVRHAHCPVLVARPCSWRGLVVCATDLSAPSLPAVEAAVAEARLRNARLQILNVIDQGLPLATVGPSEGLTPLVLAPEMLHDLQGIARATIDAVLAKLHAKAEVAVVEGHAAATILQYVEERQPELLVVGTRGRTGLVRVLLGSVAERVVRAARGSVLVVRPR